MRFLYIFTLLQNQFPWKRKEQIANISLRQLGSVIPLTDQSSNAGGTSGDAAGMVNLQLPFSSEDIAAFVLI